MIPRLPAAPLTLPFVWLVASATAATLGAGCAHGLPTAASQAGKAPGHADESVQAGGVYDWVLRGPDNQGNTRIEQEEWHLTQAGRVLDGWYERTITVISGDERLFRCNQQLGFTRHTRVRVGGSLDGTSLRIQELAFEATPGPCDDGARNLVTYTGEVSGMTIKLHWAANTAQTLHRRDGDGVDSVASRSPSEASSIPGPGPGPGPGAIGSESKGGRSDVGVGAGSGVTASMPVDGVWQWELKSVDAEGDGRFESEEWHLNESSDGIEGYYDRKVTRRRGEGTFTCNSDEKQENTTRYTISGHRMGAEVVLTEVDYKTPKSACDNGMRRLDTYQGHVNPAGDELILTWGSGNQVLHRWHSK